MKTFTIHGKPAEISDFGISEDVGGPTEYEDINRYGCSDRQFKADESNRESAKKAYNITDSEFDEICDILEYVLYVGMCGWCV